MHHFGCVVCLVCFFNAVLSQTPSQSQGGLKPLSEAKTKALIAFSNDFNGARWTHSWPKAWKNGTDGCNFYGLSCSGDAAGTYSTVVNFRMSDYDVAGDISTSTLFSGFAGASLDFSGNNLTGALPNPCARVSGSPAYDVDFSKNRLTKYDGSGMGMVSHMNLSHNQIGSPVEPLLIQLLIGGFFIDQFDVSHNRLIGDILKLGNPGNPHLRLSTGWLDFSDNCLSGNLSWLNKSWFDKHEFKHFDLSGNYWTDAPAWCKNDLCRPETRPRAHKNCPPFTPKGPV